jgi:alkylhydroperoxidase family enzyme
MESCNQRVTSLPLECMQQDWIDTINELPGNGLKGLYTPANVLGVLMNSPVNFGSFLRHWVSSKREMKLTSREQELVILRVAHHYQCNYVWGHHVPPGLEAGLSRNDINQIIDEYSLEEWSDKERAMLIATDELIKIRHISDDTWHDLSKHFDHHQMVDFVMLVSQYIFFSLINNSFKVKLEEGIEEIPSCIVSDIKSG